MFIKFELLSPEFSAGIWIEVDKIAYLTSDTDGTETDNCTRVHIQGTNYGWRIIRGSPEETLAAIARAREEALKKVYQDAHISYTTRNPLP